MNKNFQMGLGKNSFKKECRKNESGQALVMGIAVLLFAGMCALFLLSYVEKAQRLSLLTTGARREALTQPMKIANALNKIAFNNRHILAAVGLSENAYAEAADLGIYLAVSKPFTEARSMWDKTEPEAHVQGLFNSYNKRAARGLRVAQALALENKKLVAELEAEVPGIGNDFRVSTPESTWCMAIAVAHEDHPVSIPVLDTVVNNFFTGGSFKYRNCNLNRVDGASFTSDTLVMPFGVNAESHKQGNPAYGITYVSPSKFAAHFTSLLLKRENAPAGANVLGENSDEKLTQVQNYAQSLVEGSANGAKISGPKNAPFLFSTAVVHPKIRTLRGCSDVDHPKKGQNLTSSRAQNLTAQLCGALLSAQDYSNLQNEDFEPREFVSAFFMPNWAPFIVDQEKAP